MQNTLVDFGLKIQLPNIEYWQYLARYISENMVVFALSRATNCDISFETINGWTTKYTLSNLSTQEMQSIKSYLDCNSRFISYDKVYAIKDLMINESTMELTLVDYDGL